jgi:hypothetical protein
MNLLNLEDEKFKTKTIMGHKFRYKFISPMDRVSITQRRMSFQGGNPVEALTQDDFTFFENVAIVDTCTESMPDDFNQNESCIKWDSIDLINQLAHEIRTHTSDVESKLKKNKPIDGGKQE